APHAAAPCRRGRARHLRRLPQRPGDPRPDHRPWRFRGPGDGLPHPRHPRRRGRGRHAADRGRRGHLAALLRRAPPPPRLPELRRDDRGGGTHGGGVDAIDRRAARLRGHQPHPGDLRDLHGVPL
ncbi:MAG: Zinc uptake regulation protein Zur, partial [uncultured Nocardioides sp.]